MDLFWKAGQYVKHQLRAKTRYGVHSPFVYEFVTQVLHGKGTPLGREVEALRRKLRRSGERIEVEDHGAGYGGKRLDKVEKTVGEIVKSSARGKKEGELLGRMLRRYQPKNCLEFGTNLGFSTIYQCRAVPKSRFITIEGAPEIAAIARKNFQQFDISPELIVDTFEKALSDQLNWTDFSPDYVLLDGNHRYEPTLHYVKTLLPHMKDGGMLVLDDIYWSKGMKKAWDEICSLPEVTVSMDLFFLGICF
ncbi:MAG: class I SAM-dependent methyltransferase, partial [Bacteroidota bacterium]